MDVCLKGFGPYVIRIHLGPGLTGCLGPMDVCLKGFGSSDILNPITPLTFDVVQDTGSNYALNVY